MIDHLSHELAEGYVCPGMFGVVGGRLGLVLCGLVICEKCLMDVGQCVLVDGVVDVLDVDEVAGVWVGVSPAGDIQFVVSAEALHGWSCGEGVVAVLICVGWWVVDAESDGTAEFEHGGVDYRLRAHGGGCGVIEGIVGGKRATLEGF
jgi:hypothetical protein